MDVSFSKRFENIIKITNAFVARDKEVNDARDEAKFMEGEILKNATSIDEYDELCDELVAVTQKQVDAEEKPEDERDEIFNLEGPSFGSYIAGTFHRDGQMSTIYKAKATKDIGTGIVALKVTTPSQMKPPHDSEREARILNEAKSQHVVPLLECFAQGGGRLVLVFPFMRQDLENLLRTNCLTRKQRRLVFEGLFQALAHIHSLDIIHRDVKPSNILLQSMDGPAYLADFGIAWSPIDPHSESPKAKITDVGTTCYRAPELLFGDKAYDTSLDMWAAGCVVAEMIRDQHCQLFDAGPLGSELGLIKSILTTLGTPDEQVWPSIGKLPDWGKVRFQNFIPKPWKEVLPGASSDAIAFVQRLVCYEPGGRMTAIEALKHPLSQKLDNA